MLCVFQLCSYCVIAEKDVFKLAKFFLVALDELGIWPALRFFGKLGIWQSFCCFSA